LNAGLWFRRGRLAMVFSSLAASCCRCAENPLIPAVQISATTSLVGRRTLLGRALAATDGSAMGRPVDRVAAGLSVRDKTQPGEDAACVALTKLSRAPPLPTLDWPPDELALQRARPSQLPFEPETAPITPSRTRYRTENPPSMNKAGCRSPSNSSG
jgi:hypothetical protein